MMKNYASSSLLLPFSIDSAAAAASAAKSADSSRTSAVSTTLSAGAGLQRFS